LFLDGDYKMLQFIGYVASILLRPVAYYFLIHRELLSLVKDETRRYRMLIGVLFFRVFIGMTFAFKITPIFMRTTKNSPVTLIEKLLSTLPSHFIAWSLAALLIFIPVHGVFRSCKQKRLYTFLVTGILVSLLFDLLFLFSSSGSMIHEIRIYH